MATPRPPTPTDERDKKARAWFEGLGTLWIMKPWPLCPGKVPGAKVKPGQS